MARCRQTKPLVTTANAQYKAQRSRDSSAPQHARLVFEKIPQRERQETVLDAFSEDQTSFFLAPFITCFTIAPTIYWWVNTRSLTNNDAKLKETRGEFVRCMTYDREVNSVRHDFNHVHKINTQESFGQGVAEMDIVAIKDYDMQLIGSFLHCASRGDKVGLNQMLRDGTSPDVQDYDMRTALHLAASEGHASIVELLIQYNANVNLEDRWRRTPLMDARLYGHRDIIRILEVNGGRDSFDENHLTICHEHGLNEVNIDPSELNLEHSSIVEQGIFGESKKVKWRGTWVVKTIIKTKYFLESKKWFAKEISRLRELRHPNILQFLGAMVHEDEIVLITEHLPRGNLFEILNRKVRLDIFTSIRYALDIARGMNYLHQHKPQHIVHNYLCPRNLLQDEGGHLKIGEYWVQMLYEKMYPYQENCKWIDVSASISDPSSDTKRDLCSFAIILYEMIEGRALFPNMSVDCMNLNLVVSEPSQPKFKLSRCPIRIQQLIKDCLKEECTQRPNFAAVIEILEEVSLSLARPGCPQVF